MRTLPGLVPGKSCYVLELSVQPGGSRWAELHAYTEPGHLKLWLEAFCRNETMGAYHAMLYGATLGLWVVQRGVVARFIDLHPHIRAHLPEDGGVVQLDQKEKLEEIASAQAESDFDYYDRVRLEPFWDAIELKLPALEAPLLISGGETEVKNPYAVTIDTYLEDHVTFGSYDAEAGETLDPPW